MNVTATNLTFEAKLPQPKAKKIDFFRDRELFRGNRDYHGRGYDRGDLNVHHKFFGPVYDVNAAEADGFFDKLA